MAIRILVFPCGSEIGLEIHRSLRYSAHFDLVGASSVADHGRFVFEKYIGDVPFHTDLLFATFVKRLIQDHDIDAVFPAMDAVAVTCMLHAADWGVRIIGSPPETTRICASKIATYNSLNRLVPVPTLYNSLDEVNFYPIFIKPDIGYGSRDTFLAESRRSAHSYLSGHTKQRMLLLEYLPGKEWTIDCFSDRHGNLLFNAARIRGRVSNGISVYTQPCNEWGKEFAQWASAINEALKPRGAWFFQAKVSANGKPKLLEVAARLGGSSGVFRCKGVNFALLSVFDAFDIDVSVYANDYEIEMDRALGNRYKLSAEYNRVYVDLDDCLIINNKVNFELLLFLYKAIAKGKKLTLMTRHHRDPILTLKEHRISEIFDEIVHIVNREESKSEHIREFDSIFIDDSHKERQDVAMRHRIPVFSPDMIEALL